MFLIGFNGCKKKKRFCSRKGVPLKIMVRSPVEVPFNKPWLALSSLLRAHAKTLNIYSFPSFLATRYKLWWYSLRCRENEQILPACSEWEWKVRSNINPRRGTPDFKWRDDRTGGRNETQKNPQDLQQNPNKSLDQKLTPKNPTLNFRALTISLEIKCLCLFILHTIWILSLLWIPKKIPFLNQATQKKTLPDFPTPKHLRT